MSKSRRETFWKQGAHKCTYCSRLMTLEIGFPNTLTIDHIVPRSRGGRNTKDNRTPCCFDCNQLKSDMSAEMFMDRRTSTAFKSLEAQIAYVRSVTEPHGPAAQTRATRLAVLRSFDAGELPFTLVVTLLKKYRAYGLEGRAALEANILSSM